MTSSQPDWGDTTSERRGSTGPSQQCSDWKSAGTAQCHFLVTGNIWLLYEFIIDAKIGEEVTHIGLLLSSKIYLNDFTLLSI